MKDPEQYEALRDQGESKEKAARIANASAHRVRSSDGRKGGNSGSYEDWKKEDLKKRAAEIGIDGRSKMNKDEFDRGSAITDARVRRRRLRAVSRRASASGFASGRPTVVPVLSG